MPLVHPVKKKKKKKDLKVVHILFGGVGDE